MAKRVQRTKDELLHRLKVCKAVKKDESQGTNTRYTVSYWRQGVEWATVLWKSENFSTNEIAKFVQYIHTHNVTDLSETRRAEIRGLLKQRVEWTIQNTSSAHSKPRNAYDKVYDKQKYEMNKAKADYELLACEYLITHKGYSTKRLNRVMGSVEYLDNLDVELIIAIRDDLYARKGIWIELNDTDRPADMSNLQDCTII